MKTRCSACGGRLYSQHDTAHRHDVISCLTCSRIVAYVNSVGGERRVTLVGPPTGENLTPVRLVARRVRNEEAA